MDRDQEPEPTAERAPGDDEGCFRRLVDGVEDCGIILLDPAGRILTWNPGAERLTGYPADEVLGRSIAVLQPPDPGETGETPRELASASAERNGARAGLAGAQGRLAVLGRGDRHGAERPWRRASRLRPHHPRPDRARAPRARAPRGCRPAGRRVAPQGRAAGTARARAAQPPGADPQQPAPAAAQAGRSPARRRAVRGDGAPGRAAHADRRRRARGLPARPRPDHAGGAVPGPARARAPGDRGPPRRGRPRRADAWARPSPPARSGCGRTPRGSGGSPTDCSRTP